MCGTRYAWGKTLSGSGMMSMSQIRVPLISTSANGFVDLGNRAWSELGSSQSPDRSGAWRRRPLHQLIGHREAIVGPGSDIKRGRTGFGLAFQRVGEDRPRVEQLPPGVLVPLRVQLVDVDADGRVLVPDRGGPRRRTGGRPGRDQAVEPPLQVQAVVLAHGPRRAGVGGAIADAVDGRDDGE